MGFLDKLRNRNAGSVADKVENPDGKMMPKNAPEFCQARSRVNEIKYKYDEKGNTIGKEYDNYIYICIGKACGLDEKGIGVDPKKCFYLLETKIKDVLKKDAFGYDGIISRNGDTTLCDRTK